MTEEQKQKMAEGRARAKAEREAAQKAAKEATVATEAPETANTASEDVAVLKALVAQLQTQLAGQTPQIVQVMADAEKVYLRYQCECADDNLATFGPGAIYGQVTGKTGNVIVPKAEWSRFYTESARRMINERTLIVLSGMTDDEREMYNANYAEGEVLDQKAFRKLLDLGRDLVAIYPKLCPAHKEMIARRFMEGYNAGHPATRDRELIIALNELSKPDCKDLDSKDARKDGLFMPIIRLLNAKDGENK